MDLSQIRSPREWYQLSVEQLLLAGKSRRTAQTYSREVRIMAEWLPKSLAEATEQDIRQFALYRRNECELGGSSMRILVYGMRFFFENVLERQWPILKIMNSQREQTLPVVLSIEQVRELLAAVEELQHLAYFTLVYHCGLRLSEGRNRTIHDVDRRTMSLHVRAGKGAKDRRVPLTQTAYRLLRRYWVTHRHPLYLFPALGRKRDQGPTAKNPTGVKTLQSAFKRAVKNAGINLPGVRIHTLRHSFATHLLEAGVNVHVIQRWLGHARLDSTLRYFHLTDCGREDAVRILKHTFSDREAGR